MMDRQMAEKLKALGISGTANYSGDPLAEYNSALLHQNAYGTPGTRSWGEWEKISRTDPDISAVLDFVIGPLRDATVDVKTAEHPTLDPKLAQAHADFVKWSLLENLEPRWPTVIEQLVRGALVYGHSVHEKLYGLVEHPLLPNGRGYTVRKLAERMPSAIHAVNGWREEVQPNGDVELAFLQMEGLRGTKWESNILVPADKILLATWNRNGNNYRGFSAFRAVWYLAKIREQLFKLIAISQLREGAGVPTMEATADWAERLTEGQRQETMDFLANMAVHEHAAFVPPKGWRLNWVFSAGSNKQGIMAIINDLGTLILRQLQAQQMALGTGGTGSRAVGQVHQDVATGFITGITGMVEGVLNGVGQRPYCGLVRSIVDANWGPQPEYPTVTITLKRGELDPVTKTTSITQAKGAGLLTWTASDENELREQLGMKPLDPAEREAAMAEAKEAAEPSTEEKPEEEAQKEGSSPPPAKLTAARVSMNAPVAGPTAGPAVSVDEYVPRRPLRDSEKRMDLKGMDAFLKQARVDYERELRPALIAALTRLAPAVQEAMKDGDPSEVAKLKLPLDGVRESVLRVLESARARGYEELSKEYAHTKGKPGVVKMARKKRVPTVKTADELLRAQADLIARRMESAVLADLEQEALDSVRTGSDAADAVSRTVSKYLDTGFKGESSAAVMRTFNTGREQFAKEVGGVDSVELSAILDEGTCDYCDSMDGTEFDFNSAGHLDHIPPLRDCESAPARGGSRCRCVLMYNFSSPDEPVDTEGDEE